MAKVRTMTSDNILVLSFQNNKTPVFKEVKGTDWVLYGEKDDYPQYLLELLNRSSEHNAILTKKVHYIKGNGFTINEEGLTVEQLAKIEKFIEDLKEGDSLDELLLKVSNDLEIFGGIAIQSIPDQVKSKTVKLCHVDWSKIRVNKEKNKIWYSKKFGTKDFKKTDAVPLQPFDKKTFEGVLLYTQYTAGTLDYPLPEYKGSIPYIETDYEIANFHLNNVKNGFSAGSIISFNSGTPGTEEAKVIEKKIIQKFTGTERAGKVIILFNEGKDSAPTVTPLTPNNFDKLFSDLNKQVQEKILVGHGVTSPILFGIKTEGQLGGRSELRDAFEIFQNTYINFKQGLIEDVFNFFFEVNGLGRPLKIQPTEPIGFDLSEAAMLQVLTKEEIRERIKAAPLEVPVDSGNKEIINAINALSPQVANKVLEKMTDEEIRALASLKPAQFKAQFSNEEISTVFQKYGEDKNQFKVLKSTEVESEKDVILGELAFYKQGFEEEEDLIPEPVKAPVGKTKIEIRYSYEVRKGFGPELLDTSRDLCKKLIKLDRFYSREDIDKISAEVNIDVWKFRGGHYHDPGTGITTPYCRHIWKQNLVVKNG